MAAPDPGGDSYLLQLRLSLQLRPPRNPVLHPGHGPGDDDDDDYDDDNDITVGLGAAGQGNIL